LIDWWQDPKSGYWGAWYRDGERVFKTTDLSITYHIVHARHGRVRHWPELIDTTFAIREHAYPYGWLSDRHWTNHNNYDLARLFRYGWTHMSDHQRREAARTLQDMLSWSFKETVRPDYRGFHPNPRLASSLGAEFYFGASFLVAAGFFDAEPWHGAMERPAAPRDVCLGMTALWRHARRPARSRRHEQARGCLRATSALASRSNPDRRCRGRSLRDTTADVVRFKGGPVSAPSPGSVFPRLIIRSLPGGDISAFRHLRRSRARRSTRPSSSTAAGSRSSWTGCAPRASGRAADPGLRARCT
jgi:hypothetical protein